MLSVLVLFVWLLLSLLMMMVLCVFDVDEVVAFGFVVGVV